MKKILRMTRIRWGINILSLLIGIISLFIFYRAFVPPGIFFIVFLISLAVIGLTLFYGFKPYWKISSMDISRFLDQKYPSLEESSALILKPRESLSGLEKIQIKKIETALKPLPVFFIPWLLPVFYSLVLSILILSISFWIPLKPIGKSGTPSESLTNSLKSKSLHQSFPEIKTTVYPPSYLKKEAYSLALGNIKIEQGSLIKWSVAGLGSPSIQILFNGKNSYTFPIQSSETTQFQKEFDQSCFYQFLVNGKLSEIYTIEIIPDQIPEVRIVKPENQRKIEAGEKPILDLLAMASDDYGIKQFNLKATLAKGTGEAVKFKEFTEVLTAGPVQKKERLLEYSIQKLWALSHFEMSPGDALYFYITATDTHNQIGKSEVYTLSIQDTAGIMSLDGLVSGVNIKPEFFRSERQIIIDSEHLIHLGNSISKEKFNDASNNLGIDQKILRLRYGKFLGEESESEPGGDAQKGEALSSPSDFGNANKILDDYTDKHDQAEDASYFDAAQKAQLKAILNEMWKAELNLRLHKPESALPFEYKALVLLKDLQQKSRAFVSKAPFHENRFDFSKRLTGDLSQISSYKNTYPKQKPDLKQENLYQALEFLESLKNGKKPDSGFNSLLWTQDWLRTQASLYPEKYIQSLVRIQRIIQKEEKSSKKDLDEMENHLIQNLNKTRNPQALTRYPDKGLSDQYFRELYHKTP